MTKPEWGVKRACPKCGERFYDLNNDPALCPNGHEFDVASLYQSGMRNENVKVKDVDVEKDEFDVIEDEIDTSDVDIDDDLLEEDDAETVSLEEIADVTTNEDL